MNLQAIRDIRNEVYDETVIARVMQKYDLSRKTAYNILSGITYSNIEGGRPVPRQKSKLSLQDKQDIQEALKKPYWGIVSELAGRYQVSTTTIIRLKQSG